jgi:hypothetical protein
MRMPDIASRIKQWSCNCDVTWPLCNVEVSDPYHSVQQVHGEESYLDESNKKILSFQELREMLVHKKTPLVPISSHMDPAHIITLLLLRTNFILSCKRWLCLWCVIYSRHIVYQLFSILCFSPLINLFATCLMILRMLEHNKHGFLFFQSVW